MVAFIFMWTFRNGKLLATDMKTNGTVKKFIRDCVEGFPFSCGVDIPRG